jgi:hypothetical protein
MVYGMIDQSEDGLLCGAVVLPVVSQCDGSDNEGSRVQHHCDTISIARFL